MFKKMFKKKDQIPTDKYILVAALLVHAARIDNNYSETERKMINTFINGDYMMLSKLLLTLLQKVAMIFAMILLVSDLITMERVEFTLLTPMET